MGMVVGETPDRMSSDMKDDDRISASSIHKELLSIKESIKNKTSTIAVTTEDVMEQRNATSPLTIEEVGVLNLLDQGLTNQEIATQMESSTEEVSQKMNSLMQKTNVTSRTDLVRWWKDTR
jgi:DNA-binding NarL/FixJ family response regulator